MANEPLGIPRGSVRAVLSLLVIGGFVVGCFVGLTGEAMTALGSMSGVISVYYFRQREAESEKKA